MPMTSANVSLSVLAKWSAALALKNRVADLNWVRGSALDSGTGVNQGDRVWEDTRTLAASAAEDLDLAGVLTDPVGAILTFARVKGIFFFADPNNTNNVIVGGAATNGFFAFVGAATHTIIVRPGGFLGLWAPDATGYVVTAGTGDLLHVANGGAGTSVKYDVVIIGASA